MECAVHGVVQGDQECKSLHALLRGMSGAPERPLRRHEICLRTDPSTGQGAAELRLICNLTNINPDWTLRHVSAAMRGAGAEQLQAVVRTAVESRVGSNALQFFASLGFIADFEFLQEGVVYTLMRGNHTLSIAVSSLHKLMRAQDVSSATPLSPGSWLVEVTVPATSDTYTDAVAAIVMLGDQLYPLVRLTKPTASSVGSAASLAAMRRAPAATSGLAR